MSPALAGGFLATKLPGKSFIFFSKDFIYLNVFLLLKKDQAASSVFAAATQPVTRWVKLDHVGHADL